LPFGTESDHFFETGAPCGPDIRAPAWTDLA
jgi:hypothetical protein